MHRTTEALRRTTANVGAAYARVLAMARGALFVLGLALGACAVGLPEVEMLADSSAEFSLPEAPPTFGRRDAKRVPLEALPVVEFKAGDRNEFGIMLGPELAAALAALNRGDAEGAQIALDQAEAKTRDPEGRWMVGALRFQVLMLLGRPADAEELAESLDSLEQRLAGTNVSARAMRGLARMKLAEHEEAIADFAQVIQKIGNWSLPVAYMAPPSNLFALQLASRAQITAYTGMALTYALRNEHAKAAIWAEAAEGLYNDLYYVLGHPLYGIGSVPIDAAIGRAFNLSALGVARSIASGEPAAAAEPLASARNFFGAINHRLGEATVLGLQALAALSAGRLEEALRLAEEGERLAALAGLGDMVWQFAMQRGEIELKRGRRGEAEAAFRSAQNGVDLASGTLATDRAKLRFGGGKERLTRILVAFDLERGDHAALFRDIERSRARAFVDMLAGLPIARGRHEPEVTAIRDLDRRILRQRLLNGAPGGGSDGAAREAALVIERERRIVELRAVDPELADTLAASAAELAAVQPRLGEGEVLVYGVPGETGGRLNLLEITATDSRIIETGVTHAGLDVLVKRMADAIALKDVARQVAIARELGEALKIGEWRARRAAYVVPTGAMFFVPWGALDIAYPVAVLPIGGWLLRNPAVIHASRSGAIAGDPEFYGQYPPLAGARREAQQIARVYRVEPLIGIEATEENLRTRVGAGVEVLHLATHGFFRADKPLASAVVLSGERGPKLLTAARLFAEPLPAKLVILSACETGVGRAVAGDDFLGLPRSFYLGGTVAVLSSLWPVDDEGTSAFMETFHKYASTNDFGMAWLAARDRLKAAGRPPFVYGAFVLGGAIRG